jgi:hypothetical protein
MFFIFKMVIAPPTTRHPGSMESLAQFTATAVDALAKDGFCVIQLPLSPGHPGIGAGHRDGNCGLTPRIEYI